MSGKTGDESANGFRNATDEQRSPSSPVFNEVKGGNSRGERYGTQNDLNNVRGELGSGSLEECVAVIVVLD